MTNEEAIALVTKTNEILVKVSSETDSLLEEIDRLEEAAENQDLSPELSAAITATATRAHAIDELVADVPQPEK